MPIVSGVLGSLFIHICVGFFTRLDSHALAEVMRVLKIVVTEPALIVVVLALQYG